MSREYPERPIVGVGVVVVHENQVLLIRRGKPPREGQWSLPGGAQELGETARREVREEAGVEIAVAELLDVVDSVTPDGARTRYHFTLVDFRGVWQSGTPTAGGDAAAARWVPLGALDAYDLWDETTRVIGLAADLADA